MQQREEGCGVHAPFSNTRSVVELSIAEIIALSRNLQAHSFAIHEGQWNKSAKGSYEIRGRTLGIVGYGNIGAQLSVVAEALGLKVIFHDRADKLALGNARRCDTLEELLDNAEIVTLHVDGRAANRRLFGDAEFARMRPRSIFLNLARGMLVDQHALAQHLRSGHLAGAALDVFDNEPKARERDLRAAAVGCRDLPPQEVRRPHPTRRSGTNQRLNQAPLHGQISTHVRNSPAQHEHDRL